MILVHIAVHIIFIGVVVEHVITVVVRTVVILVWPGVHDVISHVDITEVAVVVIFVSNEFSSESLPPTEFTCKRILLGCLMVKLDHRQHNSEAIDFKHWTHLCS